MSGPPGQQQPEVHWTWLWKTLNTGLALISFTIVNYLASWYIAAQLKQPSFGLLAWLELSWRYRRSAPETVEWTLIIMGTGYVLVLACYALLSISLRRTVEPVKDLHGSAEWATEEQVIEAGLLHEKGKQQGVYVGGFPKKRSLAGLLAGKSALKYLMHNGPEHIIALAPTRSGKGIGLVLPTLLSWAESSIIHDPKGEVWAVTSGWRKMAGHKVIRFDPILQFPESARYNPLKEIRLGTSHEVADAQNLATIIADPEGRGLEDHWARTAQSFLTGVILHVCYVEKKEPNRRATLSGVAATLSDPMRDSETLLKEMVAYPHMIDSTTNETVAQEASAMLNRDEREMSSVLSTAVSFLGLYRDPGVAEVTDDSDFKISDLMNGPCPVSLYLVVRPSDSARLRPLVRMMLTQIVRNLTGDMKFEGGRSVDGFRYRLLFMLDEFPSLKRLPVIEDALPYMAGYGLKCYLIAQDINQLIEAYGQNESITSNCHVQIAYAPNRLETAKILSEMTGQTTIIHRHISRSGDGGDASLKNVSESIQETGRALLTPEEVRRLPGPKKNSRGDVIKAGDMLIFVAGYNPIYGQQILYFKDPIFNARSQIEPPERSDVIDPNWDKVAERDQAAESLFAEAS